METIFDNLTIIVVNWNTVALLKECLESVQRATHPEACQIIVVDNGSTDGSVSMIEAQFPRVKLIRNGENFGFARATNQGLRLATTDLVCLLNSDVIVGTNILDEMRAHMAKMHYCVACAPALRLPSGRLQTGAAGFEVTLETAFNHVFLLSLFFPFMFKGIYLNQTAYSKKDTQVKVDWLSAACLMVRRTAFEKVGLLDESFFMFAEDLEWCDRLRRMGDIHYLPHLEVIHHHGGSFSGKISVQWLEATIRYFGRRHSRTKIKIFQFILAIGFLTRWMAYLILIPIRRKNSPNMKAIWKYFQYSIMGIFKD